ncbi:putative membrane protein (TIGR04086 family) [Desulfohalotomaculum tongense]|uniref:TIGR04086 family membrane protein n=1 Tax=Desulforadius tongensis TaxID=1216062 RepID=UPI00195BA976|nr:TIGR04086 family membrane protein [Desulforadius tongensis]MBM7855308.1 putative membrane protein (TIGR04086 family) [Desulforadius tongensis]
MRSPKRESSNGQNPSISFSAIYQGILVSLVVSAVLSVLAGAIYYLTSISESTLPWTASGILCISIFTGGVFASQRVGAKGLYHGLGIGILYFILIWVVAGFFLPGHVYLAGFATKFLLSVMAGSAGGILGVGLSTK